MNRKILLTSFQTWLPHQKYNSSDDLLGKIQQDDSYSASLNFLRQLPVDVSQASNQAIANIKSLQPDGIICCGMAEKRDQLTIESNARWEDNKIQTSVNLDNLVAKLSKTAISHDAGKFVCEGLYYHVLTHLQKTQSPSHCIFVHVPLLTTANISDIMKDFNLILQEIGIE
ncbi:MAG: peptidase C15 [Moorea sp. SIO2B7]|nr:peptidase C15 [Moorena sp. SIO2B7]